jgi:nucleoside-diphosphate-sugar epimerase
MVKELLDAGHRVRVMDNLRKGGNALFPYFANPNLEFFRGDVRDAGAVQRALKGMDVIMHLAAVVGYPACNRDPWLAREVNVDGTVNIIQKRSPRQLIIFPSSLSNYGTVVGQLCTEEMEPEPITLYGTTKMEAEKHLLAAGNVIVFRPATAFGISPQMRLDLLFNDFVYRAVKEKYLLVYQPDFMRAFIHVRDFSRAFIFALDNIKRMLNQVYNLGDESLNLTKGELAQRIKKKIDFRLEISETGEDPDKRNYTVSFAKLRALGFRVGVSIDDGIDEMARGMSIIEVKNPFTNPAYY